MAGAASGAHQRAVTWGRQFNSGGRPAFSRSEAWIDSTQNRLLEDSTSSVRFVGRTAWSGVPSGLDAPGPAAHLENQAATAKAGLTGTPVGASEGVGPTLGSPPPE